MAAELDRPLCVAGVSEPKVARIDNLAAATKRPVALVGLNAREASICFGITVNEPDATVARDLCARVACEVMECLVGFVQGMACGDGAREIEPHDLADTQFRPDLSGWSLELRRRACGRLVGMFTPPTRSLRRSSAHHNRLPASSQQHVSW